MKETCLLVTYGLPFPELLSARFHDIWQTEMDMSYAAFGVVALSNLMS